MIENKKKSTRKVRKGVDDYEIIIPPWLHYQLDEQERMEDLWKELYD